MSMNKLSHVCDVDAEPLHRYREGGYHPVHLGDLLNQGRYTILHKLGWGGYSTVWAARDQREARYVAVKISVSETRGSSRELQAMQTLSTMRSGHRGAAHVLQMLDHFELDGPNGTHDCLVLELLGPSVSDIVDARFSDERLPGGVARKVARQALDGVDFLHQHGIAHGDLHTRNLAFTIPSLDSLHEDDFCRTLGTPSTGPVRRADGGPLDPSTPDYLVHTCSYPARISLSSESIKIVDFGESFVDDDPPSTLHTPLAVRAPEVVFGDGLDHRVDLWGVGCMIFELVTGQPPFDSILTTPRILVGQMREMSSDQLPERWQQTWDSIRAGSPQEDSGDTLQQWLEEVYFDEDRSADLTRGDVAKVGELVGRLLRFEPSSRASASELAQDPWFSPT